MKKFLFLICFVSLLLIICLNAHPQDNSGESKSSVQMNKSDSFRRISDDKKSVSNNDTGKLLNELILRNKKKLLESQRISLYTDVRRNLNEINDYFRSGIDSSKIIKELAGVEEKY